jgi:hypothetical protein
MKRMRVLAMGFGALFMSGLLAYGCSSGDDSSPPPASGGSTNSGGAVNTGGSNSGATGGSTSTTAAGGSTGTGTGGSIGNGGSASTGGSQNTGGSPAAGAGGAGPADASPGTGGSSAGTGGVLTGAGGAPPGTGGARPGTGGTPVTDAGSPGVVCPSGISSGVTACTTSCGPKACGLADTGTTNCICPAGGGVYTCTKCAFNPSAPNAPPFIATPPTAMCGTDSFDKAPCTTMGAACLCPAIVAGAAPAPCQTGASSTTKQQECACWPQGTSQALIWDCDTQPGL